jgi:RHS repeat-associated protein
VIEGGIATAEFFYDAMGARVRKLEQDRETVYVSNVEIRDGELARFYFAGTDRSADRAPDGAVTFYHSDHLRSSNVLTDAAGAVIKHTAFLPFGALRAEEGAKELHHRFTDKELDGTGLYDYGARQYDPEVGQFISADSAASDAKDPLTLNRYAYTQGNPLLYNDPTGHFFWLAPLIFTLAFTGTSFVKNPALRMLLQFSIGVIGGGWIMAAISTGASNTPGKAGQIAGLALAYWRGYATGWDSFEKVAEGVGVHGLRIGAGVWGGLAELGEAAVVQKALPGYGGMLYNIAHSVFNDGLHIRDPNDKEGIEQDKKEREEQEKRVGSHTQWLYDKCCNGELPNGYDPPNTDTLPYRVPELEEQCSQPGPCVILHTGIGIYKWWYNALAGTANRANNYVYSWTGHRQEPIQYLPTNSYEEMVGNVYGTIKMLRYALRHTPF